MKPRTTSTSARRECHIAVIPGNVRSSERWAATLARRRVRHGILPCALTRALSLRHIDKTLLLISLLIPITIPIFVSLIPLFPVLHGILTVQISS